MKTRAIAFRPPLAFGVVLVAATLTVLSMLWARQLSAGPSREIALTRAASPSQTRAAQAWLAAQPIAFEPAGGSGAGGDTDRFLMRGNGYTLFVDADGATVMLRDPRPISGLGRIARFVESFVSPTAAAHVHLLPLRFEQARTPLRWQPLEPQSGTSNYFGGSDPARWQTRVPHFGRLWAADLYPGVDLTFHGSGGELEYDFRVAAGADPTAIRWRADAADAIELTPSGALRMTVGRANVELRKPVAYQQIGAERRSISVSYDLSGRTIGFTLGAYDRTVPLVIDPLLIYSSLVGGGDDTTSALGLAIDASGNAYVSGATCAADYPSTPGAFGTKGGTFIAVVACEDVFVTKLNADGSGLAYSTFLRGTDREWAVRLAVDASGSAYLTGVTLSTDFPVTAGAYSRVAKGGRCVLNVSAACSDAFITKLSPDGSSLVYSTYLGGSRVDAGLGIAIDTTGAAYVTGWTNSPDLPVSATAFQKTYAGGTCLASLSPCFDAFVAKLSPDGSTLAYLTYLGGSAQELARHIAVDASGNAIVTGSTSSSDFPTTAGVVGPTHTPGTQDDIYVTKLNATGSALIWSTLVGGAGDEWPVGIAVDASGAVVVAGSTNSTNFPVTAGAYQSSYAGPSAASCPFGLQLPNCGSGFVFKLNPTATSLVFSTYLGGSGMDGALAVALDSTQHVWVTGQSQSFNFPSTADAYHPAGNGSGFLTELSADGKQLLFSTGLVTGGAAGTDVRIDAADNLYVLGIGSNLSANSVTPNAFATGSGGALVMKFAAGAAPAMQLSATSLSFGVQNIHSTSPAQTVVVSNPSATPLRLSVQPMSSTSAFLQTSDCPATLAPSGSCNVSLVMQPLVSGNTGATVAISSNAPGSPGIIQLDGNGIDNQSASFVPGTLAFPDQQAGTTGPRATSSLQSQATDVYARLKTVTLGGANPNDFDVNLGSCTVGGAYCTVDAAFKPLAGSTGTRSATVSLGINAYGSPFVLTLTGTVATGSTLITNPGTADFNNVSITSSAQQSISLVNTGASATTVSALTLSGTGYGIVSGGSCATPPFSLAPQGQCSVFVQLQPTQTGTRAGTLTITDGAPGSPHVVALTGIGVDPAGPQLLIGTPKSAMFGAVVVGSSFNVPQFFNLFNFGGQTTTLAITVPPEFPLNTTYSNCGTSLTAGSHCTLALGFAPTATGLRSGTVSIASNAPGTPATIALSGTGVLIASVTTSPQKIDFGRIGLNITSPVRSVTIPNTGNATLNITSITATGPFLVTNRCGATLAAGASCAVDLQATPTALGVATGLLSIVDDAAGNTQGTALSVEGVSGPALQTSVASLDFGRQSVGASSAALTVTLTNTGAAAATLAGLGTNGDFVQTSTCGATLAIGASCSASVAFRPTLVSAPLPLVGVLTVAGSFGGSPLVLNLQGLGVTSTGAATQTQLTAAPNPATVGQPVTLTAAVGSTSSGSPSGTVTFFEGAAALGSGTLASGQATLALSTLPAGAHSITAQYGGDTSFGASTAAAVSVQVNAVTATADFSVQATPTALTVVAGQSATTTLSVTPINGFTQAVSLACSGLPAGATCSFAPASVTPAGAAVSTVLTIATNGNTVSALAPVNDPAVPGTPEPGQPATVLASLGVIAIRVANEARLARLAQSMSQRWRGRLRRVIAALATLGAVALIGACGGSPSGGGVSVSSPGTPAGTSTVTVTATSASGTVSHALTLSLVVTR